jgi:hypothetical protein
MADLIGFTSIALVSLIVVFIGLRWPHVSKIIYVALIVRVIFILIGHYIIPLPDSTKDAAGLEDLAWNMYGKDGFFNALSLFPGLSSFFYSWIVGVLYSLFGRSILMAQSLSLFFGIGSIFLAWFISKKIWDNHTATKVGWVLALFPSLILYSVLPLREVFQGFFLLIALIGIFYWVRDNSYKSIFLAVFGFIGATFFHGALLLGGVIFLFVIVLTSIIKLCKSIISLRINLNAFVIMFLAIIFLQFYFLNKIYIPKLGYFDQLHMAYFLAESKARMIGDASYGGLLNISSYTEIFYKAPLRVMYFLFSPFPWNVEKLSHLIGMFDGILYMLIVYLILSNLKIIWKDPFLRIILIILFCYLFMFAFGVSNFGAGLRHRSKFIIMMIILIGPLIPKFIFSNKVKLTNKHKNKF